MHDSPLEVTSGQHYDVGEKPTVILYTYIINRHAGTPFTMLSIRSMFVMHIITTQYSTTVQHYSISYTITTVLQYL